MFANRCELEQIISRVGSICLNILLHHRGCQPPIIYRLSIYICQNLQSKRDPLHREDKLHPCWNFWRSENGLDWKFGNWQLNVLDIKLMVIFNFKETPSYHIRCVPISPMWVSVFLIYKNIYRYIYRMRDMPELFPSLPLSLW